MAIVIFNDKLGAGKSHVKMATITLNDRVDAEKNHVEMVTVMFEKPASTASIVAVAPGTAIPKAFTPLLKYFPLVPLFQHLKSDHLPIGLGLR